MQEHVLYQISAWAIKRAPSCLFCWGLTSLKMLGCGRFVRHWFYTTHILTFVPICAKRSSSVHTKAAPAAHCINVYLHHRTSDHFIMTPVWDCSCISCAISRLPAAKVLAFEWDLLARIARHLKGCQPPLPLKPPTNRLDPDRYDMVRHGTTCSEEKLPIWFWPPCRAKGKGSNGKLLNAIANRWDHDMLIADCLKFVQFFQHMPAIVAQYVSEYVSATNKAI